MTQSIADKHKAENEVIFRQNNERMVNGLKELKQFAVAEDQPSFIPDMNARLQFYCECSDENCRKRVSISSNLYTSLHKQKNYFVILPGHSIPEIEKIVDSNPAYEVVEKYIEPPLASATLHATDADNV